MHYFPWFAINGYIIDWNCGSLFCFERALSVSHKGELERLQKRVAYDNSHGSSARIRPTRWEAPEGLFTRFELPWKTFVDNIYCLLFQDIHVRLWNLFHNAWFISIHSNDKKCIWLQFNHIWRFSRILIVENCTVRVSVVNTWYERKGINWGDNIMINNCRR